MHLQYAPFAASGGGNGVKTNRLRWNYMSRYLVTGCAGFIGSWLTQSLVERGEEVRGLDNFETGKRENLSAIEGKFEFVECDLRDAERTAQACAGVDAVFHVAALPSVPRS